MEDHNKLIADPEKAKIQQRNERNELKKCSLCEARFTGFGHNADPFEGRCCEKCNHEKVLPERQRRMASGLNPRLRGIDQNVVNQISESYRKGTARPWEKRDTFFYEGNPLEQYLGMPKRYFEYTSDNKIEVNNIEDENLLIHLFHMMEKPPPLVYSGASVYGHFLRALHDDDYLLGSKTKEAFRADTQASLPELETLTPFVINHDWARLLASAGEAEGGDISLPRAEATVFEFSLEGMRILILATELPDPSDIGTHVWVRINKRWIFLGGDQLKRTKPEPDNVNLGDKFYLLCNTQVRAACIMLESEIAETNTIRADYKRNEKRQRHGQTKFFDYHIINLAKRHRYSRPAGDLPANDDKRASPRLHFVKGHWRHFDNWKTKIKWHYRGDADLGFVDKEYRL